MKLADTSGQSKQARFKQIIKIFKLHQSDRTEEQIRELVEITKEIEFFKDLLKNPIAVENNSHARVCRSMFHAHAKQGETIIKYSRPLFNIYRG